MPKFVLIANAQFMADNIDDAFLKLSEHFEGMYDLGLSNPSIFIEGNIEVSPNNLEEK